MWAIFNENNFIILVFIYGKPFALQMFHMFEIWWFLSNKFISKISIWVTICAFLCCRCLSFRKSSVTISFIWKNSWKFQIKVFSFNSKLDKIIEVGKAHLNENCVDIQTQTFLLTKKRSFVKLLPKHRSESTRTDNIINVAHIHSP